MRNVIVAVSAALILTGAFVGGAAADSSFGRGTHQPDSVRHWSGKHHRFCRDIYRSKVVWRHGRRHVVRVKVGRRCN